jgi:radical SAM superfamily enzyme YgiQ (UPF0313 family)
MGISIFAGEAEGRLDVVLCDAAAGRLDPVYNFMKDLPGMEGTPVPFLPKRYVERTLGLSASFDAGRGCPYQCSFCTIINVQGKKSRRRSPDDIEKIVRENVAQGLHSFFITDDNFARNTDWEAILDRLISLRQEGIKIHFIIQVDTLCHRIPRFIEKCAKAGVRRVFIGLENINPDSLVGAKKRQNKITEYRKMLQAWKDAKVITYAGYILGFPNDTPESIVHDIEIIKRELPVDLLEFFFLTPLPGSEDHQTLVRAGATLDADLNRYDLNHATASHSKMSRADWEKAYRLAWATYYTMDHMDTVLRRIMAKRGHASNAILLLTWFKGSIDIEKIHPLESGFLRLKFRRDRRPGMAILPVWRFYPQYFAETLVKLGAFAALYGRLRRMYTRVKRDPGRFEYDDLALAPVTDDDVENLELFHTPSAQAYVARNAPHPAPQREPAAHV